MTSTRIALGVWIGASMLIGLKGAAMAAAPPCGWSSVGGGLNGSVFAMEVFDDGTGPALFVGGAFTNASGQALYRIGKWNGQSWSSVGGGLTSGTVYSMQVFDDGSGPALFIGGTFVNAGGVLASNIVKWNGSTYSALGQGTSGVVRAMTEYDDDDGPVLIVGGSFINAGGQTVNRIARWNGSAWSALTGPGEIGMNNNVLGLTTYHDGTARRLVACGQFTMAGGLGVNYISEWKNSFWLPLRAGLGALVSDVLVHDDGNGESLYAMGQFVSAPLVDGPIRRVTRWTGSTWAPIGLGVDGTGTSDINSAFSSADGPYAGLYVGGRFTQAGTQPAKNIAHWDGQNWATFGAGVGINSESVEVIGLYDIGYGPTLFAGGNFTMVDGAVASRVAQWRFPREACRADLDENCIADFFDVQAFLNHFSSGSTIADFNSDGLIDFFDIAAFLAAFSACF
ncbi:MAG: hypothetical protein KF757_10635 [Phycisphaeraceae bacterium]|nr:hypothetical protein [Phycisphaeraceae bacterium]MCW5764213.1 hypothetical protein [Phycisphaeraceae bacterium]